VLPSSFCQSGVNFWKEAKAFSERGYIQSDRSLMSGIHRRVRF
jgi:hypothetical protein